MALTDRDEHYESKQWRLRPRRRIAVAAAVVAPLTAGALWQYGPERVQTTATPASPASSTPASSTQGHAAPSPHAAASPGARSSAQSPTPATSASSPNTASPTPMAPVSPRPSSAQPPRDGRSVEGCLDALTPITPRTMRIDALGTTSRLSSKGSDAQGAPIPPPKSSSHGASWWTEGPRIGSQKGHAVITVHSYRSGGALGNTMEKRFRTGDVVRFTDSSGRTQCYRLSERQHLRVKDWNPDDGRVYNDSGSPEVVIITCTDFNWTTKNWDSRWIFHLTPVAG